MKTLTVRLPDSLAAAIEAESRRRKLSKSDIVRERLERAPAGAVEGRFLGKLFAGCVEVGIYRLGRFVAHDLGSRKRRRVGRETV